ncbi:MAG: class I adenylate-forming enzyme family protein [Planctomycetota bacterium]|nr:class I adenylate-forming enzyme family protein [Planctomycetota bacterium]
MVAGGLSRGEAGRGDRVAICLENSVESVLSVFGVLKAGGVYTLVNPTAKSEKIAHLLDDGGVHTLITDARRMAEVRKACARAAKPARIILVGEAEAEEAGPPPRPTTLCDAIQNEFPGDAPPRLAPGSRDDLAALPFTSGSTGRPKGVMLSHGNLLSVVDSITEYLGVGSDDIFLTVLSLSFNYSLSTALVAMRCGATMVIERSFTFPAATLQRIQAERVTVLPIVPTIAAVLLQMDLSKYDLASLRTVTNAAAPLPVDHLLRLCKALPNAKFFSMYGQTECTRVCYLPPHDALRRPDSVGIAIPGTQAYVVDEQGNPAPPGQVGELVVHGPHVMQGYWNLPEENAKKLRPAKGPGEHSGAQPGERALHTGDLFRTDDDGYLYFVSRSDDLIKSRGEKVSPREVESAICAIDGVAEAAVLGVPDPVLGQAVKAFVVLRPGASLAPAQIKLECRRALEEFMVPQHVELLDSLPRNDSGKVDKLSLRRAEAAREAVASGQMSGKPSAK